RHGTAQDSWFKTVHRPEFRDSFVVLEIVRQAAAVRQRAPVDACEQAELAIYLGQTLPDGFEKWYALGYAYKELANTLITRGQFLKALKALDDAEDCLNHVHVNALQMAVVRLVRAITLQRMDRHDEGCLALVRSSAEVFLEFGETGLFIQAQMVEAMILYSSKRFNEMRELQDRLVAAVEKGDDLELLARIYNNTAECCRALGDHDAAASYLSRAIPLFSELELREELVRARWSLAHIERDRARYSQAIAILYATRAAFEMLGNATSAATAALELVELLLVVGDVTEAARLARPLPRTFLEAGMTSGVIAAANYIREITRRRRATPDLVRYVQHYFAQAQIQSDLPFHPPADGPRPAAG
ncbi:MAG TPA: tetratricopeptide repeat protein, partial [Thermoanaerobaculia bacterium]|nr:tetratricopeptide repeat protein [Thermoanaerobaculia bacterium]